jgi:GWxTD domain-containing protein
MKAHIRTLVMAIFVGSLVGMSAYSQTEDSRRMQGPDENRGARVQDEIVTFEPFFRSVRADSADVDILFRFRRDFLVFARSPQNRAFTAEAEVTVEIIDSTESSIARHIQTFSLSSDDNSQTFLQRSSEQGFISFHLRRGRYTALCIVTDKESEHKQFSRRIPLMLPRQRVLSSGLLLAQAADTLAGVTPCNLGGSAFFDRPLFVVASIPARARTVRAVYSLDENRYEGDEKQTVQRDTAAALRIVTNTALVPSVDSAHNVVYRFARDTGRNVVIFSLNGQRLSQGRYTLRLQFDAGDTATVMSNFAVRWIDMPQSLRDLDFASSAMKYITTDEEYDHLTSGRRAKRIAAFDAFWKKLDPTPETAYNERLAEYFRRVDYASQNFKTLKEENGVFTDRGKIYILYGKPTATERLLSPSNAPREVWQYPSLKKLFTFEDTSRQGNYKLIQTDNQ